jgi:hypothetical protein
MCSQSRFVDMGSSAWPKGVTDGGGGLYG